MYTILWRVRVSCDPPFGFHIHICKSYLWSSYSWECRFLLHNCCAMNITFLYLSLVILCLHLLFHLDVWILIHILRAKLLVPYFWVRNMILELGFEWYTFIFVSCQRQPHFRGMVVSKIFRRFLKYYWRSEIDALHLFMMPTGMASISKLCAFLVAYWFLYFFTFN